MIDKLPPLKDRNGYVLCSDLIYRDVADPRLRKARVLITKLDTEIRMFRDANNFLESQKPKTQGASA